MRHRLDSSREKIARAKELAAAFDSAVKDYYLPAPFQIRHDYDEQRGHLVWRLVNCKPPSLRLGVLVGEVVHHLRSALDHAVFQLIESNGKTPGNKSGFPIFSDVKGYRSKRRKMIRGVSAAAEARIELLQPFHKGAAFREHPLWILQNLNNTDKHRLLAITVAFTGFSGEGTLEFEPPLTVSHGAFVKMMARTPVVEGEELLRIQTTQRRAAIKGDIPLAVVLETFPKEAAVDLMGRLAGETSLIVESFAPEF